MAPKPYQKSTFRPSRRRSAKPTAPSDSSRKIFHTRWGSKAEKVASKDAKKAKNAPKTQRPKNDVRETIDFCRIERAVVRRRGEEKKIRQNIPRKTVKKAFERHRRRQKFFFFKFPTRITFEPSFGFGRKFLQPPSTLPDERESVFETFLARSVEKFSSKSDEKQRPPMCKHIYV